MADEFAKGLFRNPITGKEINTAKHAPITGADLSNQGFSALQSRREGSGETFFQDLADGQKFERFEQRPAGFFDENVIGIDNSNNNISEGTDDITSDVNETNNNINKLDPDTDPDTSDLDTNSAFEQLKSDFTDSQSLSAAEITSIESDAEANQSGIFDPLIDKAKETARQGRANNLVATGRRGGLQRARFVGDEVFASEFGKGSGTGEFEGAGGKLQLAASAFQKNIQALEVQKARAIQLAKSAAKKAALDGKAASFAKAKDMFTLAQDIVQKQKDDKQRLFENMFKLRQEDRLQTSADFSIIKEIPAGETLDIDGSLYTGIKVENIEPFWTSASIVSLMKSLPEGETQEIKDPNTGAMISITGLKAEVPNTQIFKSTNQNNGTETFTTIDKTTGEILNQKKSVGTGATFKAGSGNADTGDKDKDAFFNALDKSSDELRTGKSWGSTFNIIFNRYKTGDAEQDKALTQLIDSSLNKDFWSQEGAFQKFKSSTKSKTIISQRDNADGTTTFFYSDGSEEVK